MNKRRGGKRQRKRSRYRFLNIQIINDEKRQLLPSSGLSRSHQKAVLVGEGLGQILGKDDVTVLVKLVAILLGVLDAGCHAHCPI